MCPSNITQLKIAQLLKCVSLRLSQRHKYPILSKEDCGIGYLIQYCYIPTLQKILLHDYIKSSTKNRNNPNLEFSQKDYQTTSRHD